MIDSLATFRFTNPTEHPKLSTHKHYIEFMSTKTKNIQIKYGRQLTKSTKLNRDVFRQRINLINLTFDNLDEEYRSTEKEKEYARVCCSWVSVKCYYLIFYLETILLALIDDDVSRLKMGHNDLRRTICSLIKDRHLVTSSQYFNIVLTNDEISNLKVEKHANIRPTKTEQRFDEVLRIIYRYSREEYKYQAHKKGTIKSKLGGEQLKKFNRKYACLFDFFYYYRIKSSYKDMDFIANDDLPIAELYNFYRKYCEMTVDIATALKLLINDLYKQRIEESSPLI